MGQVLSNTCLWILLWTSPLTLYVPSLLAFLRTTGKNELSKGNFPLVPCLMQIMWSTFHMLLLIHVTEHIFSPSNNTCWCISMHPFMLNFLWVYLVFTPCLCATVTIYALPGVVLIFSNNYCDSW